MNPSQDPSQDLSRTPSRVCILWHPPAQAPSASLIRALSSRGLCVMPTASPHTALAGACRCAKTAERVVLVLDSRDELSQLERVCSAIDRFAPSVICWVHHPGANPPMVPLVRLGGARNERDAHSPTHQSTEQSPQQSPIQSTKPPLRLVGEPQGARTPPPKSPPLSARDVLDADELDALLAGELSEGRRGK